MNEMITREELFESGLKICSCCGSTLPLCNFGKRSNSVDGLLGYCKECAKKKRDKYYESDENKAKARNRAQKYRDKNRQEINTKRRQQYQANEDVRKKNFDMCKRYKESHKKQVSEYQQDYRLSRLDFLLNYSRQYYQDHQEYFYEWRRSETGKLSSVIAHEKRRCLLQNIEGSFTTEDVANLLIFFDNKCAYTGEPLEKSYHLDHIIPLSKGGENYIWNIVPSNRFPNLSKGVHNMEMWYRKQPYFSEDRLQKIYSWINLQKSTKGETNHGTQNIEEVAI